MSDLTHQITTPACTFTAAQPGEVTLRLDRRTRLALLQLRTLTDDSQGNQPALDVKTLRLLWPFRGAYQASAELGTRAEVLLLRVSSQGASLTARGGETEPWESELRPWNALLSTGPFPADQLSLPVTERVPFPLASRDALEHAVRQAFPDLACAGGGCGSYGFELHYDHPGTRLDLTLTGHRDADGTWLYSAGAEERLSDEELAGQDPELYGADDTTVLGSIRTREPGQLLSFLRAYLTAPLDQH